MSAVLLARVRDTAGQPGVAELLRRAGSARTPEYLSDIANWISLEEGIALWRAGAAVTHHPQFARAVGEDAVRRLAGSPVANLLRSLGSPERVYEQITTVATKYSNAATLEAVDSGPGYVEIRATVAPGLVRDPDHCAWTCGLLSQPTALFGLPPATVEHEQCAAFGAATCEYRVTWPVGESGAAGGQPGVGEGERVAHLERQLEAMRLRVDSMFQTAADLIGSGDIGDVLGRIAGRAAHEVRAPGHLLAVRMTPGGPLHCHHKGLDPAEVPALARQLLEGNPANRPAGWLDVPVRSTRRSYGRLLAVLDPATRFLPQERELLEVYARYAATALDGATALQEAERRYAQSSAQLELARALALAGTSAEIARRLTEAVPLVVDCDRVAVYLWDPDRGELSRQAYALAEGVEGPVVSEDSRWRPDPGGMLERLLRNPTPDPVFLSASSPSRMASLLGQIGFVATVLVPLVTRDELLGLLAVSVRERPERLLASPDLHDRLSGVAAQATTALQNGRLVDVITHQATHDQLTGLANRVRFTSEVHEAVARAESGALFYLDLDRFKPVNDEFGHQTGDQLLVAVADRLRRCTRAGDVVARLGGDEFAVLLIGAGDADVERVADRIVAAFDEPFEVGGHRLQLGVSIGRSRYPLEAHDVDGILRLADAAMFEQKRSRQGRPAVAVGRQAVA